jgi:hypothetical protein
LRKGKLEYQEQALPMLLPCNLLVSLFDLHCDSVSATASSLRTYQQPVTDLLCAQPPVIDLLQVQQLVTDRKLENIYIKRAVSYKLLFSP